ncbi:Ger(x)C family spore germination protein [Bacillus sp. DNRA2]|uniref:Ger(x)C family spore germination protein n=1 Tax=Bacillus sp. DNRA2 TaxID=2723053 RepID=UPI00145F54E8|nr:Ger(x)C family spore germination protein [Bacillus sp. DNRA2]NMD72636.1 Ger(x)C family spore germination protein [Bacillus sp. DNRA2]
MNLSQKFQMLFLSILSMVILFGCSRTRIIDKISIIHVFGFDQAKNGEIIGTALSPEYTKSKDSSQIKYIEEQAITPALILPKMAEQTSTPVEIAKIRILVFGKDLAESGIRRMVDRFIIIPQLGTHIQIAVSTHSARETLRTFKKEKSLTLADRIEHNMVSQNLPKMNLHYFLNDFYGEGMDAYVPMLTIDEKNTIKIDGIGVFKDDKFKLHLTPEQTFLFSILKDYRNQATFKIDFNEKESKEFLMVRAFRSTPHWDWDPNKKQLNLRLELAWTLVQHPDRFNPGNSEDLKVLKKIVVEKLETGLVELFNTLKENKVDPVGIGNIVRSQNRTWDKESFYKQYPTLPIKVDVNFQIIHTGLDN